MKRFLAVLILLCPPAYGANKVILCSPNATQGSVRGVAGDTEAGLPTVGMVEGCMAWAKDTDTALFFDGASWIPLSGGSGAPTTVEYVVAVASAGLSAERVGTDTATIDFDAGTAAQAKWNLIEAGAEAILDLDDLQGNLGVAHLNSGTSASSSTFWRGDGTWATPSGASLADADYGDFTVTGGVATIDANAVALGTDTTGNYALGDAEGGAATTGDSATAFFSSGQIEAARGGTGDDTSGTTGVPRIAAGNWTYDAGISHLAASTSADLRGVLSDETGTGAAMFGLTTTMSDDLSCSGTQVVRRNAADTAFECVSAPSLSPPASVIRCYADLPDRATYATQAYLPADGCWIGIATNTNAAWNNLTGTATRPGLAEFTTGTTSTGAVRLSYGNQSAVLLGGGQWTFETSLAIPTLSTSSGPQRFIVQAGFQDSISSPFTDVDGVFFQYSDNINSGEWLGVCSNNSTTSGSTVDSNIAVGAGTYYKLKVVVNAAGSSAEFFVDGSSIGTCSTNIPTSTGRETAIQVTIAKTNGTNAATLNIDYAGYEFSATTSR